ncbi:bifunctional 4-hydroxy-2-oxoglutarate aldolase/2-dehydro-3-deoxy-phosphogluconate aldolase [Exilibacterium tricleocarpae]|uniref:2-dehydro-3-deoxy-phosphogluconate aldolase n=1 Tax=Exilibacterium tricleocarpae TaxID=2591008 RepID=A0A545SS10_9GAMM|nr:bifunctional 4-hydroxy-2-oxoglutarate aldolase/2-dehydro-3-deoxy-phosphogluconate aldolase [Exilibacterium tricleocarpae]TQV67754.1 bifunctional 4-hydroxy-2-oxoglutarate aldolase/2-dehydro-3-deoxy-phosphogluconate aldolase [Exilibacterium tricleocarpae]
MNQNIQQIMAMAPVIPVMVIDNPDHAVPLARALVEGGLPVLEITLRTPAALAAIEQIRAALPEAVVGAGTVITPADMDKASDAGAAFIVSPGATTRLIDAAVERGVNFLPGVSSPSEAMVLLEKGFSRLKFFPAQAAGGIPMLKSIYGPLAQLTFCPTGGINLANAEQYLALPNVACVGGSWMAAPELVQQENWQEIKSRAQAASQLAQ